MRALILAAGLGTRLRPITNVTPKPLVKIGGEPLLRFHLDSLSRAGVDNFLINTHYLPDQIEDYVKGYAKQANVFIKTTFEEKLLGSAGTLEKNKDFFEGEEEFLIVYGDNLTDIDYNDLLNFHKEKKAFITIACYHEASIEAKGMVVADNDGVIRSFVEKPKKEQVVTDLANAGIYVFSRRALAMLKRNKSGLYDFGHDFFPDMLLSGTPMYRFEMRGLLLDIGTIEAYELANRIVEKYEIWTDKQGRSINETG